jgi:two-component system, OmpR family, response regulator
MKRILLAENEAPLAHTLSQLLVSKGLQVTQVRTLQRALKYLDQHQYDLVIVDRILDDGDGLELVEYTNQSSFSTRTLCLSQLNQTEDRIKGLDSGADEYIGKPFSGTELMLRVNNLLSKQKIIDTQVMTVGPLKLYTESGVLLVRQRQVLLRKRESEILTCLIKYRNQVISRDTIIDHVWYGDADIPTYTTLDVYIRRIRVMLRRYRYLIKTVRGFGYMFKV